MGIITNYKTPDGTDIGMKLVEKAYLLDRYPELVDTFRFAGLWLSGQNSYGMLNTGDTVNRSSPVQTLTGGANWKYVNGGRRTLGAIKSDNTLWLCGSNAYGQFGNNTTTSQSTFVQAIGGATYKQFDIGFRHVAAVKTDGSLWLWGGNNYGQLGTNNIANQSSPVQTAAAGTNWKQVACGRYYTAAIKTNGTLWMWGHNNYGQLGDNTSVNKSSPVQTAAAGTNWRFLSCGYDHSSAIKTDGTLWSWGQNDYGALGDGTTTRKSSPVQTSVGGTNWKTVSISKLASSGHSVAIKTDGTLWSWGPDSYGQMGDNISGGSTSVANNPQQTISGGTNWAKAVAIGNGTAAIKTDGTLWTWGRNAFGELGDNTLVNKSSPVQTVASGSNWKFIAAGYYNFMAIRDNSEDLL